MVGQRQLRSLVSLVAALLLVGCQQPRRIWSGSLLLGPEPMIIRPGEPLNAPGPRHEVCFGTARSGSAAEQPNASDSTLQAALVTLRPEIVLIAPDGHRDRLGFVLPPPAPRAPGDLTVRRHGAQPPDPRWNGDLFCFQGAAPVDRSRVYEAVEIVGGKRSAWISEVYWWSGQRMPSL